MWSFPASSPQSTFRIHQSLECRMTSDSITILCVDEISIWIGASTANLHALLGPNTSAPIAAAIAEETHGSHPSLPDAGERVRRSVPWREASTTRGCSFFEDRQTITRKTRFRPQTGTRLLRVWRRNARVHRHRNGLVSSQCNDCQAELFFDDCNAASIKRSPSTPSAHVGNRVAVGLGRRSSSRAVMSSARSL